MAKYIFTFKPEHPHAGSYHVIVAGEPEEAEAVMHKRYGKVWSGMYDSRVVDKFINLVDRKERKWPATDEEIERECAIRKKTIMAAFQIPPEALAEKNITIKTGAEIYGERVESQNKKADKLINGEG
jgi:hypothetical protein